MYRILIVDDEPMALYSTAHTFPWADWGFDPPVLMTEAPAALDNLRTERFDAAIVDIRMPQMTGILRLSYQVQHRAKKGKTLRALCVRMKLPHTN